MHKLLLLSLALLASLASFSQKYSFVTYSTEEGLPQSQVTAISQGEEGYLWVGTLGGLAKFNGKEFVTFSSNDGLWNNRIKTLSSFDGKLWVGHDGGISTISNNKIQGYGFTDNNQSRHVSSIIKFKGKVLVCTTEGGLFEFKDKKLVAVKVANNEIDRIRSAYVSEGKLYLATRGGVLVTRDLKSFAILDFTGEYSYASVTGNDELMIFAMYSEDVIVQEKASGKITTYSFEDRRIIGCYLDRDDQVWLNTDEGIVRIKKNGEKLFLDDKTGLPINMTSCFYQDNNANIWIGSRGKGIFRFPGLSFQYFNESSGYKTDFFLNGFQKPNGDTYYGTYEKGVLLRRANGDIELVDVGEDIIWASVQDVDGKDWFGAQSSVISMDANHEVEVFEVQDGAPGTKITSFYRIDANSMYVGGNEGVAIYKNGKFTRLGQKDVEFLGTVRDIVVVNGVLYCGSNLGLFVYRDGKFRLASKNTDQVIYSVEVDQNGAIWYGAEEGLFRYVKGKTKRIKLLNGDPGSNFVNFLNIRGNMVYVGSNNGLFVINDLNRPNQYKRYGIGDGIPDLETNLNSGFFDNGGNFWFGTSSGLVCFHQDIKRLRPSRPIANLRSILLNYEAFDYGAYGTKFDKNGLPKKMVLPYSKNNVIFDLDGVSLVHHRGLKYQFWLEGLSKGWSPLSDVSTFTFTNLPAGDYVLKMRAVDIDGRMSDEIEVEFVVEEAYYKTWWFLLLCLIVTAGIVLLIFKMRIRRVNEKNEQEKLIFKSRLLSLEQKSVNASMNRHFIFNALNSIQYFINTRDRLSANKYLTNFAQLIRKNLDTATADHNIISLEEEIERLQLYLSLESMRFKDRFEYEINTPGIDVESIKIPAMIMQPFIENSIIHGILPDEDRVGLIAINMKVEDEVLHISIEDNGIGVNQSMSRKGDMDGDHRSQGMEITSKRIELIQKISNQGISMEGPEEILNDDRSIKGTRVLIKIPVSDLVI